MTKSIEDQTGSVDPQVAEQVYGDLLETVKGPLPQGLKILVRQATAEKSGARSLYSQSGRLVPPRPVTSNGSPPRPSSGKGGGSKGSFSFSSSFFPSGGPMSAAQNGGFPSWLRWLLVAVATLATYVFVGEIGLWQRERRLIFEERQAQATASIEETRARGARAIQEASRPLPTLQQSEAQPAPVVEEVQLTTLSYAESDNWKDVFMRNRGEVHELLPKKTYRMEGGYYWIRTSGRVQFTGSGYVLQQGGNPDGEGCSDVFMTDGRARSTTECENWLVRYSRTNVMLTVRVGGSVTISTN